jgi:hypothetical protein
MKQVDFKRLIVLLYWKMVGTYRQMSNLHALKMFHMYDISSQEFYINTLLSDQEELMQ